MRIKYSYSKRYIAVFLLFSCLYILLMARLVWFGLQRKDAEDAAYAMTELTQERPDIFDRNGLLLARDIHSFSLFAQPRHVLNPEETAKLIKTVLPNIDLDLVTSRLRSKQPFVWLERNLSLQQKSEIMALGLPGLGFRTHISRFYPNGADAAYVVGYVDVDNKGLAGIEKYLDEQKLTSPHIRDLEKEKLKAVYLSIDIRGQAIIRSVLERSLKTYNAQAAGAVILNAENGEILAMDSVPSFMPDVPGQALNADRLNRMSAGLYEMGSVIKIFTTAMALDSGKFTLDSMIDASHPLAAGRGQYIHDFHGKNRPLSLSEVFIYSSNIGSAKEALAVGVDQHKKFLDKLGLLTKLDTEIPEVARPVFPKKWKAVNSMTISFGHGMMNTPLQTAVSAAALLNGGILRQPTFLRNSRAPLRSARVLSPKTSQIMRNLFALNMKQGSGRFANIQGYNIGGKTGTAEKVENGKYVKNQRFNSFIAAFPIEHPKYIVLTIIDNPQAIPGRIGSTAGYNAAPMAVEIINRCANFLGVRPNI
ncbi:MAG: penicillin-binding protein 2 [Alphaproteobacteria bacterium]|nr:penicillin-binding protein 2 [Alphaproteobacteria bacterium]